MTRMQKTAMTAILAATFAVVAGPLSVLAQTSPSSGADAKACQLMPTPDLEAAYGGKVTNPHGSDEESSVCTVNIGGLAVKLLSAPPGTIGLPTSIQQGLVGARLMSGVAKQSRDQSQGLWKNRVPEHEDDEGIRWQAPGQASIHGVVFFGRERLPEYVSSQRKS